MALMLLSRGCPFFTRGVSRVPSTSYSILTTQALLQQTTVSQRRFFRNLTTKSISQPPRAMWSDYLAAVKARRSYYPLKKESPIKDTEIKEIVSQTILHTPYSFNNQSSRAILLLKDEHDKLWDIAKAALKTVVPSEQYPNTERKLDMFRGAYGTVSSNSAC
jgi:hypothetical protein